MFSPRRGGWQPGPSATLAAVALRVLVADDHALIREGVAGLLADAGDIAVVGTARDLPGLLTKVDALTPDVVVTDIRMPPSGTDEGIRAANRLRERHPAIGVVVLSMYAEPAYARGLLGDGTGGRAYLLKSRVREVNELVAAIRAVAAGGSVVDPQVVESLLGVGRARRRSELDALTAREREVLAAMATGLSNASIAERLSVNRKTVETHTNAIFSKLGLTAESSVNRRVAAVLAWLDGHR